MMANWLRKFRVATITYLPDRRGGAGEAVVRPSS
jgi:hypothetical protein